jgi:glucose-1-phosphate thymidylyltransferase
MRGIILAGGTGSRLHPITRAISKQLMPVYDKPMVYYPLSTLMMAGIRDVLVITTPEDAGQFERLLADGKQWGLHIVALVLGDNIFYGPGLGTQLRACAAIEGAHVFGYRVADPTSYGVVELDDNGTVISIEEKPKVPKSRYAVPGLYFYDNDVVAIARGLKPSARGELEITAVHEEYRKAGRLTATLLPRGTAWLDTGTFGTLVQASEFIRVMEERQGLKIGCVEEIAWRNGWIGDDDLRAHGDELAKSGYGRYLHTLLELDAQKAQDAQASQNAQD